MHVNFETMKTTIFLDFFENKNDNCVTVMHFSLIFPNAED